MLLHDQRYGLIIARVTAICFEKVLLIGNIVQNITPFRDLITPFCHVSLRTEN